MIGFKPGPPSYNVLRALILLLSAAAVSAADDSGGAKVLHRLPSVSSIYPQGSQPGTRVRVEILGQHLDRAERIAFLDPSVTGKLLEVEPTRLVAEFATATAGGIGPHYFRVISPRGASNAAIFRLGSLPHRAEREPNSTMDEAETVTAPVTINARLDVDNDFDFFRFRAASGETLIFDLRAARNGSSLDAALILLDSRGRKLEHDEDTFIWDPFIVHRFAEAGDYFVVVQPTHARNDPGFAYQLDIRRDAHLETVSPIAVLPGVETEVTVYGQGLLNLAAKIEFEDGGISGSLAAVNSTAATVRVKPLAEALPGPHRFKLGESNWATILVDPAPVRRGRDVVSKFPASIVGTARYRVPEEFGIEVHGGQSLVFEVRAQRYGSPVDSVLRLLDPQGKVLATNDDGKFPGAVFNKDSLLEYKFSDGGLYRLEIRNLWATTGENFPYQISIRPPQPHADLLFDTENPYVVAGQKGKLKISASRVDGLEGDIPLEVKGLPEGVTAKATVILSGAAEVEIELDATGSRAGALGAVEVRSPLAWRPAWRGVQISSGGGEGRHYGEVNGAMLAVVEQPLFSLECAATAVNLARGGTATLKVGVTRSDGFEGRLTFAAMNLPPGVTMELVDDGPLESTLRFRAAAGVPAVRAARVSISGSGGGQTHAAPKISLLVD